MLAPWKENYDQPRQHIKKQRHYFANKGPPSQSYGVSSSHVWMWELDYKESWVPKNRCFWTVVLVKTLESPLDCKEIQPVHPKGYQSWVFIGWIVAEAETPILWPRDVKNWLHLKRPWSWDRLRIGGEGDNRRWDDWMALPTQWTWVWVKSRLVMNSEAWHAAVHWVAKSWTWLSSWTELNWGVHLSSTEIPCHPKDCRMARRLRKLRKSKVRQWLSGKESASQCRRHKRCRFDPWVGKVPWRWKCNPLQYSCLGKSHRQRCLAGYSPGGYKRVEQNLATQQQQQSKTNGSLECPLLFCF